MSLCLADKSWQTNNQTKANSVTFQRKKRYTNQLGTSDPD